MPLLDWDMIAEEVFQLIEDFTGVQLDFEGTDIESYFENNYFEGAMKFNPSLCVTKETPISGKSDSIFLFYSKLLYFLLLHILNIYSTRYVFQLVPAILPTVLSY